MVSPEAVSECSKDAPGKPLAAVSPAQNGVAASPNTLGNDTLDGPPVQIKILRDLDVRQPSYVSLARCISGYTVLTTYDSKQREGYRSRDISPARVPVINNNYSYQSSNGSITSACLPIATSLLSPVASSTVKPQAVQKSSPTTNTMESNGTYGTGTSKTTTSFVLQRVERIFGPGALAQGFYSRRMRNSIQTQEPSVQNVGNGKVPCQNSMDDSLPVLKLLRPEFRAQLSVAKHRTRSFGNDQTDATARTEYNIPVTLEDEPKLESLIQEKNGVYYLEVVHKEMAALERLANDLQVGLDEGTVPEELEGELRSTIGKARLLVAEKLRQFEGLCHRNISPNSKDEFKTTNEDLAGFWDMVSIQVNIVRGEIDSIIDMRANRWQKTAVKKIVSPSTLPTLYGSNSGATRKPRQVVANGTAVNDLTSGKSKINNNYTSLTRAKDEARRKLLQERRLAMKKSMSAAANQDQVFAVEQNSS